MSELKIGIIGGSGMDDKLKLTNVKSIKMSSPFGAPSDLFYIGKFGENEVVLLARHGAQHRIPPSLVNFRANIWCFKELGVRHIIATTACGSLREEIEPGHLVFIDQFIDRTYKRESSFYTGMQVCHIPMREPFCPKLRNLFISSAKKLGIKYHSKGTMITIEGPRFSTKAESLMFRQWGGDVINMTTVPEVVLAREAGICYGAIAMSTDYDCWHESKEPVTLQMVLETMEKNANNVLSLLKDVIPQITSWECECQEAYKTAII